MTFEPQRRHVVASVSGDNCGRSLMGPDSYSCAYTCSATTTAIAKHPCAGRAHFKPDTCVRFLVTACISDNEEINAASTLHPDRSLAVMSLFVLAVNAAAVMLHLLAFATGTQQGTSVLLDFVGQGSFAA